MCIYIYLFIYLFIYLSIYLFMYSFIYLCMGMKEGAWGDGPRLGYSIETVWRDSGMVSGDSAV